MIKLIIFDLDGVLIKTKMIHFHALNKALVKFENYKIPLKEHLEIYDGLPTITKLFSSVPTFVLVNKNFVSDEKSMLEP